LRSGSRTFPEYDPNCLIAFDELLAHLWQNRIGQPDGIWMGWAGWAINARGDWEQFENDGGGEGYLMPTVRPYLPATCSDGQANGEESDVDCGGVCRRCDPGAVCAVGTDCRSGACADGSCL
jgi:hypothetical protein